jgi:hypothetical protein
MLHECALASAHGQRPGPSHGLIGLPGNRRRWPAGPWACRLGPFAPRRPRIRRPRSDAGYARWRSDRHVRRHSCGKSRARLRRGECGVDPTGAGGPSVLCFGPFTRWGGITRCGWAVIRPRSTSTSTSPTRSRTPRPCWSRWRRRHRTRRGPLSARAPPARCPVRPRVRRARESRARPRAARRCAPTAGNDARELSVASLESDQRARRAPLEDARARARHGGFDPRVGRGAEE